MANDVYNKAAIRAAKAITESYSTSFSVSIRFFPPQIRQAIYSIYGFVRVADEIVDTFTSFSQKELLDSFEKEFWYSKQLGVSTNPVLHAFIITVNKYNIPDDLISAFLRSMRLDLVKSTYVSEYETNEYIYGSAEVVGLMCLKVFCNGNETLYNSLKHPAQKLGAAFQKVNFLRDLADDTQRLNRSYFPSFTLMNFTEKNKCTLIKEIENDFRIAYEGILRLPLHVRTPVYIAYLYYKTLLRKLAHTSIETLLKKRLRVSNFTKIFLTLRAYIESRFNFTRCLL